MTEPKEPIDQRENGKYVNNTRVRRIPELLDEGYAPAISLDQNYDNPGLSDRIAPHYTIHSDGIYYHDTDTFEPNED
jgi:hypothetical protein